VAKTKKLITTVLCTLLILSSCTQGFLIDERKTNLKEINYALKKFESSNWQVRSKTLSDATSYLNNLSYLPLRLKSEELYLKGSFDEHPEVRIESIPGLIIIYSDRTRSRVMQMALVDESDNVKWIAIKTLAIQKNLENAHIFARSYKNEDPLIREAAITGLLSIADLQTAITYQRIIIAALNDPTISVRVATLKTLSYKNPELYTPIVQNLKTEKQSISLLTATLQAMQGYVLDDETKKLLIEFLSHRNRQIRIWSLRVLKAEQQALQLRKGPLESVDEEK
jgi:hypothetical protein